ncbi:MAG: F0F1 ATP synthase subunit epsilon [Bacteroidales bacterium]|nr:F0F1 ATP synthase subunit epsilon [Bacteroidales bacterium]
MDGISLHVLTADGPILERMVESLNLPTAFGSVGVLKGHADMLCNLEAGILRLRCEEGTMRLRISSGIASVEKNEVNILVSSGQILED